MLGLKLGRLKSDAERTWLRRGTDAVTGALECVLALLHVGLLAVWLHGGSGLVGVTLTAGLVLALLVGRTSVLSKRAVGLVSLTVRRTWLVDSSCVVVIDFSGSFVRLSGTSQSCGKVKEIEGEKQPKQQL